MRKRDWRSIGGLLAAIVLPLVLFAALQSAFSMQTLRRGIENDALGRARQINAAIDAQLQADESALQVLSGSQYIRRGDWDGARDRAAGVQADRPQWKALGLTDLATGRLLWRTGPAAGLPAGFGQTDPGALGAGRGRAVFGGISGAAPACPCVTIRLPVWQGGRPRYLLSLARGAEDFQQIVLANAPAGGVTAVVDGQGRFIARSKANRQRLATPATHYVREAIVRSTGGLYSGVTYEGLKNYTAFDTSKMTGWSAHVAVNARSLNDPMLGSLVLTVGAGLISLLAASVLAALILRQERLRSEEEAQAAQSQKLAAIGQMASGLAHDFNNLLMVIGGSLRLIADRSPDPALSRTVQTALAASDRGAKLVQQLMAFTRSEPLDIGPVDLSVLLASVSGLLEQSVGPGVRITIEVRDDARHVASNANQLELAILNLSVNARDAMPAGGVLSIRTRPTPGRADCVDLIIADTGEGMTAEVISRAMDPFFTTKPAGKGTGLGLSQVFGVVNRSGGTVSIDSAPGAGTTVTLRLKRDA